MKERKADNKPAASQAEDRGERILWLSLWGNVFIIGATNQPQMESESIPEYPGQVGHFRPKAGLALL